MERQAHGLEKDERHQRCRDDILPTHPPAELLKFRMFSLQETQNIRIIPRFKICNKAHPRGILMANSAQARKRARQNISHHHRNMSLRSQLRTAIKHVRKGIASADKATAQAAFQTSVGTIDSIADKGIIHKNKAARHKSRLAAAIKAMA
jgi:small subunit ribosomal protein S20